jgi:hypothetical protein
MKIRELKRKTGNSAFHVWPPVWAWSYRAESRPTGDEGVLTDVHRWDIGLWLAMMYDGREHRGSLTWDPPPALADVGKVLKANLGREIKAVGELNVEAGEVMTLRITLTELGPPAVLALDGRLTRDEVVELRRTAAEIGPPIILDLTWLQFADREGVRVLHELRAEGARFTDVSPYLELLLGDPTHDTAN